MRAEVEHLRSLLPDGEEVLTAREAAEDDAAADPSSIDYARFMPPIGDYADDDAIDDAHDAAIAAAIVAQFGTADEVVLLTEQRDALRRYLEHIGTTV